MSCGLPHKVSQFTIKYQQQKLKIHYLQLQIHLGFIGGGSFIFGTPVSLLHVALLHRVCFLPASVEDSVNGLSNV